MLRGLGRRQLVVWFRMPRSLPLVSVRTTRVCMNNMCLYRTTCVSVCYKLLRRLPPVLSSSMTTLAPLGTHTHTHTLTPCAYLDTKVSLYLHFFSFSRTLSLTLSLTPLFPTPSPSLSLSPTLPLFPPPWQRRRAHALSITLPTDW
jgi:hypothetical protein